MTPASLQHIAKIFHNSRRLSLVLLNQNMHFLTLGEKLGLAVDISTVARVQIKPGSILDRE